ncbi:hypothetical protein MTY66_61970 (plasmid) [Mycolicibacterium sp. TY66]|nr:hypothetical protein MTY66_61970 [Mycolicibacterium sp. TY66]BCJ84802.1 hypothetical protein MTY81_61750 [Mycolicibacterium sp. TY81]
MVYSYDPESRRVSRRVLRGFSPERFKALRKATMTLSDLVRASGVTASSFYAWEAGTSSPQVDKLAAAMQALGHPIESVVQTPVDERFPGDWRVLTGLTQPQLAASANISTSNLQRIESGERAPTDEQAEVLAGLVGTDAEQYRAAWLRARKRPPGTPA